MHELPREAVFDAFCADFSPLDAAFDALDALDAVLDALDAFDAVLDALDIAFAGFAPLSAVPPAFNALSAFPPGTHVATSKANSSNEQLPVHAHDKKSGANSGKDRERDHHEQSTDRLQYIGDHAQNVGVFTHPVFEVVPFFL